MSDTTKEAASLGGAAAAGAGGGAVLGALMTLLQENPTLKKTLKNSLAGGVGGAAIGSGVHALGGAADNKPVAPSSPAPSTPPAPAGKKGMSLPIAALSGLVPGLGPAAHALADGEGATQAAGSALASAAGPTVVMNNQLNKSIAQGMAGGGPRPASGKAIALSALLSVLGATGAAAAGNKLRE